MNVITLRPSLKTLTVSYFETETHVGTEKYPGWSFSQDTIDEALRNALHCRAVESWSGGPPLAAVWLPHAGDLAPVVEANPHTLKQLHRGVANAPLHIPVTIRIAESLGKQAPDLRLLLVSETAFFSELPQREQIYALDETTRAALGVRRQGFHGLYHRAAYQQVASGPQERKHRLLSICMEGRPELAAILHGKPLMVTGGATPLEGLPGLRGCGELDAGVVLALAKDGLGPEEINNLLSSRSGLSALAERVIDFGDLAAPTNDTERLAREVFDYRLLLACGAGIAALRGLDTIVFSGRFARLGEHFAQSLVPQLARALRRAPNTIGVEVCEQSLESLVAKAALDYSEPPLPTRGVRASTVSQQSSEAC